MANLDGYVQKQVMMVLTAMFNQDPVMRTPCWPFGHLPYPDPLPGLASGLPLLSALPPSTYPNRDRSKLASLTALRAVRPWALGDGCSRQSPVHLIQVPAVFLVCLGVLGHGRPLPR